LRIALQNENIHGIILLYCQTAVCDAKKLAESVVSVYGGEKPIVAGFVGGKESSEAIEYLNRHGIPAYDAPEKAVDAMYALMMWRKYRKKKIG